MPLRTFSLGLALLGLVACQTPASRPVAAADADAGAALAALLAEDWERRLAESPEFASYLGDTRYNDRWSDLRETAIAARHQADRDTLARLEAIDPAGLSDADRLNHALFARLLREGIAGYRYREDQMPVSPINWTGFGSAQALVRLMPFATARDYEDWLARLAAYGELVDQHIALMEAGRAAGRLPPKVTMTRFLRQLEAQQTDDPEQSPLYAPFQRIPPRVDTEARETLAARAQAVLREVVLPAEARFRRYFAEVYLPACPEAIAATALPDGEAYYAHKVRQMTTTDLSPEAIHETGLAEVARIRAAMEAIREEVGFKGDLAAFFTHLRSDPQFFHTDPQALLDGYRIIAKRIDPELVKLFGRQPRTPYGVLPVPEAQAPDATTAYYQPPAKDGSRAGYFYANLYKLETRPIWEMEALTLHEASPGHHFQIALAQELGELPPFRRLGGYTAYVEGWGLYAESLGAELGLYTDPYSRFGQLTYEMWRAVRLVVDTGMHAKGWSRQQAIEYFAANAPKTRNDIEVEIDRYISWPGQALAYKIGELRIKALRAKAEAALGERFDVRAFHDTVLGDGALPLDLLETRIDAWIAAQSG
jgi:uncharacterized protein (DUF885 family)